MRLTAPSGRRTIAANDTMLGETRKATRSPRGWIPRSSTGCPGVDEIGKLGAAHGRTTTPVAIHPPARSRLDRGRAPSRRSRVPPGRHRPSHGERGTPRLPCRPAGRSALPAPRRRPERGSGDPRARRCRAAPGRLPGLAPLRERRPIALGEQCERERDREEGDRRHRAARAAREPDCGESRRERRPLPFRPPACHRREDTRDPDRSHDREESRQQEERATPSLAAASRSSSAAPLASATAATSSAAIATRSTALEPCASRVGNVTVIHTRRQRRRPRRASPSPRGERTLSRSTSPTGAPARLPPPPPTAIPSSQPTTTPDRDAGALDAAESHSCQRRAPNHVSRRRAASRSRRMPRAASTVNANRSAAASPPTSSSRVPATSRLALPRAAPRRARRRRTTTTAPSARRGRARVPRDETSISHRRGRPGSTGQTQA